MAALDVVEARKVYPGGVEAVKGVSVAVPDGAMCVLVGPSGCGKSTLLRMIAGLETITSGSVAIGGRVMNELGPSERDIAMVFQTYALYPHMSVEQNMSYGLRNRGMDKAEIARRVREAARMLELEGLLGRLPRELSGGQRQRVAMGRAIVRKPAVFLFDEPLSNLDAKLRGQMRVEIKALQRALGVTSVYVTHDQLEAMTLADTLVVMNAGRVEQIGAPLEVYDHPASLFVAGFIGAPPMNLLPLAGLPPEIQARAPAGAATMGVRPEHLTQGPGEGLLLEMEATGSEPLGAETHVHGRIHGAPALFRSPEREGARPGERLTLRGPRDKIHWFNQEGRLILIDSLHRS